MTLKKTVHLPVPAKKTRFEIEKDFKDEKDEIEFVCKVFFYFNSEKKLQQYCILIQSVKLYTLMHYELIVEMDKKDRDIDINILGVNSKASLLSEGRPAAGQLFCDELAGKYIINVIKQNGNVNSAIFDFNLPSKEITLINEILPDKLNNRRFCRFEVDPECNTFS